MDESLARFIHMRAALAGGAPLTPIAAPAAPLKRGIAAACGAAQGDPDCSAEALLRTERLIVQQEEIGKRKRGGQPKPLVEKRRQFLAVWVNESEMAQIKGNAELTALPVSVFCRQVALGKIVQTRPSEEYTAAMTHFVHLCGNINAISKNLHQARHKGFLSDAVTRRVEKLCDLMEALDKGVNVLRGLTHSASISNSES